MSTQIDSVTLWTVILGLAAGSYLLRFVFIGIIGGRPMPPWMRRHLRYTAVAMLPALVAPLVVWPAATGGTPDVPRMAAAGVTLVVAYLGKNVIAGIASGAGTLYALLFLLG